MKKLSVVFTVAIAMLFVSNPALAADTAASTGDGTCQIRAHTSIDSGTANSIDFVGTMVGRADVTFS